MKKFANLLAILFLTTACESVNLSVDDLPDAGVVSTSDPPLSHAMIEIDRGLAQLRESSRLFEDCIMPSYGLYVKSQTCDMPPSSCQQPSGE